MCLDTEMKYVEHKCAYTWESAPRAVDDIGDTDGRQLPQFPNQRRRSAFEMIMTMFRNLAITPQSYKVPNCIGTHLHMRKLHAKKRQSAFEMIMVMFRNLATTQPLTWVKMCVEIRPGSRSTPSLPANYHPLASRVIIA